jgi:hypothetical protein
MATVTTSQRPHTANVFKPAGVKPVQTSIPWADGGTFSLTSKVDLQLPITALRLRLSGRLVISGADFVSGNPEGFLNLLSDIQVSGNNSRSGGNLTLWDIDLATLFGIQHLFQHRAGSFTVNGVSVPIPATPWPAVGVGGYFTPAQGTYDFSILVDLPFHPLAAGPGIKPGYLVRSQEWGDSLTVTLAMGSQPAAAPGMLGTPAGGTVVAWHAIGTNAGSPTIDVYSLPIQMGSLKDSVMPGVISRVTRPLTQVMQAAGNNVSLLSLQKTRTSRIFVKSGTSVAQPAFNALNDTNLTALGLQTGGGGRLIKPLVDVQAYKQDQPSNYQREPIQGYTVMDFLASGNPDSSFSAGNPAVVASGSTFELVGNVAGLGNAFAIVIQEQIVFLAGGALYSF